MDIGIGVCGPTDFKNGLLITSPILQGWNSVPIRSIFSENLKLPVVVDNDANLAIFGEYKVGAGKGFENVVGLTLGTGVGGGIILGGKIYRGSHWFGGEFSHMTVRNDGELCLCGNKGCLTVEASTNVVVERFFKQTGRRESPQDIFRMDWDKDVHALKAIAPYIDAVSTGIANILNIFDPDCVLIGGGVANVGEKLFRKIDENVKRKIFADLYLNSRIILAQLDSYSGAVGAGILAVESAHESY
jgi:glucokinase